MQEDDRVSLADRDVTHFSIEDGDTVSWMWIRWTGGHRHLFVNRACGHRFRNPIGVVGFYEQRSLADLISARNNMVSRDNAITTPGTSWFARQNQGMPRGTTTRSRSARSSCRSGSLTSGTGSTWRHRLGKEFAPRAQAIHGLRQFAMLASIGSRLLTIAAQI